MVIIGLPSSLERERREREREREREKERERRVGHTSRGMSKRLSNVLQRNEDYAYWKYFCGLFSCTYTTTAVQ